MSVGATLSATDPVTILAIFNTYKVDPKLYTVIFGESILNDAIAIVLFETAQKYKEGAQAGHLNIFNLFESIGIFLLVFFGSLIIGLVVGIGTSLLLKYTLVRRFPKIESCLIILIAYASYFFANAVHLSGQVTKENCHRSMLTLRRYCVVAILWYLLKALCLPQHVAENTANNEVHLSNHGSVVRKLHFHLLGSYTIFRDWSGV